MLEIIRHLATLVLMVNARATFERQFVIRITPLSDSALLIYYLVW